MNFYSLDEENLPDLCVEVENASSLKTPLTGNRVVDIGYFIEQVRKLYVHDSSCTMGKMVFDNEIRKGLVSNITFRCNVCNLQLQLKTQNCDNDINRSLVWGISSVGGGYSQADELFSLLNVPIMSKKTYKKEEGSLHSHWEELLMKQMRQNAMEEKQLAIAEDRVEQGIPYITVIVDGGWAKRSYGHSYTSLAGVACIIGQQTKKLLYIGIKNKFCYICATGGSEHKCYRNYAGSSTGMEQTIIVEGFNKSEEEYGIRYKYVVGDGDSSVYTRILENVSYGRYVIKLECANHVTRAFTSNLHKITKNTSFDCAARNIVRLRISGFSALIRTIVARTRDIHNLRTDLKNSTKHIFGDHQFCRREVCKKETVLSENVVPLLESANIFTEIVKITDNVVRKADRLNQNVTTNLAERYMSIISKFTGGKRTNLIQRGQYKTRCIGAGLSFNSGISFHTMSTKGHKHFLTTFCSRRLKRKMYKKKTPRKSKTPKQQVDMDYGENAAQPDLQGEDLILAQEKVMSELNSVNIAELEKKTIGQRENIHWHQARRNRLTASSFGKICLRRSSTPSHNLLKELFYKNLDLKTKPIQYGIENEKNAIEKFQNLLKIEVTDCGLFVCEDYRYLGASPDGLTDENGIVEVKCLYSIKGTTIHEALQDNRKLCVQCDESGELFLKQNHHYYFQIQGQLNICNKQHCYLILYTDVGIDIIKVARDRDFWLNSMLPKLIKFWEECALPELSDPRIPRGLRTRDNIVAPRKRINAN